MHLEVVAGVALLRADLGEPGQQPVQLLAVAAGVHPAVPFADRAPECSVGVTTHQGGIFTGAPRHC